MAYQENFQKYIASLDYLELIEETVIALCNQIEDPGYGYEYKVSRLTREKAFVRLIDSHNGKEVDSFYNFIIPAEKFLGTVANAAEFVQEQKNRLEQIKKESARKKRAERFYAYLELKKEFENE